MMLLFGTVFAVFPMPDETPRALVPTPQPRGISGMRTVIRSGAGARMMRCFSWAIPDLVLKATSCAPLSREFPSHHLCARGTNGPASLALETYGVERANRRDFRTLDGGSEVETPLAASSFEVERAPQRPVKKNQHPRRAGVRLGPHASGDLSGDMVAPPRRCVRSAFVRFSMRCPSRATSTFPRP